MQNKINQNKMKNMFVIRINNLINYNSKMNQYFLMNPIKKMKTNKTYKTKIMSGNLPKA